MNAYEIKIGDKVETGVFVLGEWKPLYAGIVIDQSTEGSLSKVDIMSLHGGAPWIILKETSNLRKLLGNK